MSDSFGFCVNVRTLFPSTLRVPFSEGLDEVFSPLVTSIPIELFAATRAELLGESYFRGFGGGRSQEGGGGISRIRTSDMLDDINLE